MSYVTVSCLTLFIITLNEFIQSAPMGQKMLKPINRELLFVNKEILKDFEIIYGDVLKSKSKNLPVSADSNEYAKLWNPNEPIPIYASQELEDYIIEAIETALDDIQRHTCLRFKNAEESDMQSGVIAYQPGRGCASYIGKQEGVQPVFMNNYCYCSGIAVHETMHALGFVHEHQRSDRDDYVEILYKNIKAGGYRDFTKLNETQDKILGPYDYDSIMHYSSSAYANAPNVNTIEPKERGVILRDECTKDQLSKLDIDKLNKLYDCASTNRTGTPVEPFVLDRQY